MSGMSGLWLSFAVVPLHLHFVVVLEQWNYRVLNAHCSAKKFKTFSRPLFGLVANHCEKLASCIKQKQATLNTKNYANGIDMFNEKVLTSLFLEQCWLFSQKHKRFFPIQHQKFIKDFFRS
jgi:hypothetical protein